MKSAAVATSTAKPKPYNKYQCGNVGSRVFLTFDDTARNKSEFKKLVDEEMRRLITSREIYPIYDKWFNQPIPPTNTALNLPVSYLLRDFWKYPTDQVPF